MPGPRDIYTVAELYDAFHWWKTNDLDFIANWATDNGGPVLELAAGTGRLGLPIAGRGLDYTGLELSPQYVVRAEQKLAPFSKNAYIIQGDMRSFKLDRKFKSIFIGFNSFLHLYSDKDARACLQAVQNHLLDDGKLLIEIFVPDPSFLNRPQDRLYPVCSFSHPDGGYCTIKESNDYDAETEINSVHWYFFRSLIPQPEQYNFDMRIYYPDTMDRLLNEAGFKILEKFGDRKGNPLTPESELQIYICGK